jgi:ERCC4-type nuclease
VDRIARWMWPVFALLVLSALLGPPSPAPERVGRIETGRESGVVRVDGRAMIDLNRADEALLESIPGVGPVLAGRIAAFVREKGALTALEEISFVEGIGPAKLLGIKQSAVAAP